MSERSKRYDAQGDRMKSYERIETEKRFRPNSVLHVRLDGRGFSKFTKGLKRPYDQRLSELMVDTAKYVLERYKCTIGYTQSDEMSFILKNEYGSTCDFDGKIQKLVSNFASTATAFFNANLASRIPEKAGLYPEFDCRIFEVPDVSEATNSILWREQDAIKNSVSMLAQHYFSHKELQGKSSDLMKDMLKTQKNILWEDQPKFFKSGTFVKRELYIKVSGDMELGLNNASVCVRSRTSEIDVVLKDMEHSERMEFIISKSYEAPDFLSVKCDKKEGEYKFVIGALDGKPNANGIIYDPSVLMTALKNKENIKIVKEI